MENNARKFNLNPKLLAGAAVALGLVLALTLLLWPSNIMSELTIEAGAHSVEANDFRKEDKGIDAQFVSDMTAVDLNTPGKYPVKVQYKNKTYDCTVLVEDTTAPVANVRNVAV